MPALLTRPLPLDLDVSRRRFLGGTAAAGLLAGCGTAAPAGPAGAPAADGFPRTVRHEAGETVLDRRPARVVSVTDGAELGALLALGVTPVAFGQRTDPLFPWVVRAGGEAAGIERFPLPAEVSFEQLAALQPDVLIGQYGFVTEETFATYQGIAPTVATSFIDWRESLRQVGEATGTEQRAREVAADLEAQLDAAAGRLAGAAGARVTAFAVFEGNEVYVLNAGSPAGEVLARVGAAPLPAPQTPGEAADPVSAELVGSTLDADVALVLFFDGPETGRAPYDAARATGIFDSLTAFRTGRVVELSGPDSNALYFSNVLTVPWVIEVVERVLGT